jgi:hypothetical protein
MPVDYSQAKIYKNVARKLVMVVCYRDIFNRSSSHSYVRKAIGPIDFESDYMKRISFTCEGKEYYIRLWDIKPSPSRTGKTKIEYTAYEEFRCWRCDEEFSREMCTFAGAGSVLCRKCRYLPGNKIEVKNEEQIGQQTTTTTTNQE